MVTLVFEFFRLQFFSVVLFQSRLYQPKLFSGWAGKKTFVVYLLLNKVWVK